LAALEKIHQERDKFESIIQKLQAKYQPLQSENVDLKKQLKQAEEHLGEIEAIQAEHDTIVEMATLDREMAEEQYEGLKSEVQGLRAKIEELELENEILQTENEEFTKDMDPEERTSQHWIHLERENSRLREALIRLRDITQDAEEERLEQIKSLEEDVADFATVKSEYESTKERLLECEADIEDLKQQLDAALGAEDMIEELTEKNMALSERNEQLKSEIEDLQNLQELNEELEVNHVENEKQLQEVISYKDMVITEHARFTEKQKETISDQEYTITKFRELVISLQSDLEDMRASKEITETEAQDLSTRSRAMMDLNRQLAASATSTKTKTIEMELKKLEAEEAAEHLSIVQLFLPDAFRTEKDSVLAFLRFKRIGFKSNLVHHLVKDRLSLENPHAHDDDVFDACDALAKLAWISAMCQRFTSHISSCSLEEFSKFESALYEIEPVERGLNSYIEILKNGDLKEKDIVDELRRSMDVLHHLSEARLTKSLQNYANEAIMRATCIQTYLDNTAAGLSLLAAEVRIKIPINPEDEEDAVALFSQHTDTIISATRSAKVVASKILASLSDLKARSMSIKPDTVETFEQAESEASSLLGYIRQVGASVYVTLHEEGREDPIMLSDARSAISLATKSYYEASDAEPLTTFATRLSSFTNRLAELHEIATDLTGITEFERGPSPWALKSKELAAAKLVSVDAEDEIRRLKEDIHERATQLKLRDQSIDEAHHKIELLESRTRDASKKTTKITELEQALTEARNNLKSMEDAFEAQAHTMEELQNDRDKWHAAAADESRRAEGNADADPADPGAGGNASLQRTAGLERAVATDREVQALKTEIAVLESLTQHLRKSSRRDQLAQSTWLSTPLKPDLKPRTTQANAPTVLEQMAALTTGIKPVELDDGKTRDEEDGTEHATKVSRLAWKPLKRTPRHHMMLLEETDLWLQAGISVPVA
jgi:dynactin 1